MKAVQINKYGGNEVIEINDNAQKPSLGEGQILVSIQAASINPVDAAVLSGYLEKMMPLTFPITLGGDFSGIVSQVQEKAIDLKVGDEVYGQALNLNGGSGTFAQIAAANIANTALKPKTLSFVEEGALPLVGVSAVQALEEHIKLKKNQKILIHGGTGGIGHIAIQLAKALGAYVATTVSPEGKEFARSLGADEVIDYKTQSFDQILKNFDSVFDTVGGAVTNKSFKVLKKGAVLVSMAGQPDQELAKQHQVIALTQVTVTNTQRLNRLRELVDGGKIKPHIDKIFPLDKIKDAFDLLENGHPKGKVVLKI